MKKLLIACAAAPSLLLAAAPSGQDERLSVRPSEAHLEYQGREIMALVHWGLNPYTNQEWGFGNAPVSMLTPQRLDPAQWVRAMKAAEVKSVVLVAKHHDGFCLWPSKLNRDYSMAAVPAPNTGRDLVREMSDACRREGLKFGVYLSPWDRHQGNYSTPAYVDYFFAQWNDIFDNYGEICEIWLDGANGGTGWYGGANGGKGERRSIPKGYYRKPDLLALMHRKHPRAVAFGGHGDWSASWCGNECGISPETWWCPRKGDDGALHWMPSEADFPLRRGWFFHASEKPKSLARLVKIYFETVGRGAVMNLGIAPDKEGRVCEADEKRLAEFGDWVRDFNSADLAKGAKAAETRDGNSLVVELTLPGEVEFNCVDIKEKIADGQRIASFSVEEPDGGGWRCIAKGTTVGHRRLARVPSGARARLRVVMEGIAAPSVFPVALRMAKGVSDEDLPPTDIYSKQGWRIVDETCRYTHNAKGAIDGNYHTLWHTHPTKEGPQPPPQSFTADCGKELLMHGFDYIPRLDGCRRGMVDAYEFHVSPDGKAWTKAGEGEFGNIEANPARQRVTFASPVKARYFRFTGTHSLGKNDHVALAEIDLW
ncbi:MAG: alpha-L-fucosidase [Kiritimatiellae bacterium]|nr:alpha-L-fucosidase [Kiritimatiellia bacterium]